MLTNREILQKVLPLNKKFLRFVGFLEFVRFNSINRVNTRNYINLNVA